MRKLLLVIDAQNDFINENTKNTLVNIEKLVESKKYDDVVFTRFINNEESIWYTKLNYSGCIDINDQEILVNTQNYKVFDKYIYTALNDDFKKYLQDNDINEIYLCGFDTDACVLKTALDLFENGYDVYVLKDYCMSHKGIELHNVIINNLKSLIGRDKVI